jgi:hypothetical protein
MFESLPRDMMMETCKQMDNQTLQKLIRSSKLAYDACLEILNARKKDYEFRFYEMMNKVVKEYANADAKEWDRRNVRKYMQYLIENYTPFEMQWRYLMLTGPDMHFFGSNDETSFEGQVENATTAAMNPWRSYNTTFSWGGNPNLKHFIPKDNNSLFEDDVKEMLNQAPANEKDKWLNLYHQKTLKPTREQMKQYVEGLHMNPTGIPDAEDP